MEEHGNTKGTYHLHGNNGNPNGSHSNFRKYGLLFEAMQFFYYFQSVKLIWIYFVTGRSQFFHYVKLYGLIFMHKISTRVVCANGEWILREKILNNLFYHLLLLERQLKSPQEKQYIIHTAFPEIKEEGEEAKGQTLTIAIIIFWHFEQNCFNTSQLKISF